MAIAKSDTTTAPVAPEPDRLGAAPRRGLRRWIAVVIALVSLVIFYTFATHATFDPFYQQLGGGFADNFFTAQAHAVLHGQLAIDPGQIPGECWVYQKRCYGYFGLTPSVLRMPLFPLLSAAHQSLTALYLTVALLLCVGGVLAIVYRVMATVPRTPRTQFLGFASCFVLGPGGVLIMLARPAMYEESIAWGVAFSLLSVYAFLRWWDEPRWRWALSLVAAMGLAVNARPTAVPIAVVLAVGAALKVVALRVGARTAEGARPGLRVWLAEVRLRERTTWRYLALAAIVAAVPIGVSVAVYWFKFHSLLPNPRLDEQVSGPGASPYWLALRRVDHESLSGIRFIPTDLLAYIRPDGLSLSSSFPFANFRFGASSVPYIGIPSGSILAERWTTIPVVAPLGVVLLLVALTRQLRTRRRGPLLGEPLLTRLVRSPMTYAIAAAIGAWLVTLTQCGITNRYLGDAVPLFVLLCAVSLRSVAPGFDGLGRRRALVLGCAVAVVLVISLLVNLGIEYQDWWHTTV